MVILIIKIANYFCSNIFRENHCKIIEFSTNNSSCARCWTFRVKYTFKLNQATLGHFITQV